MSFAYNKVAIIGKHYNKEISESVVAVYKILYKFGIEACVETVSAGDLTIKT